MSFHCLLRLNFPAFQKGSEWMYERSWVSLRVSQTPECEEERWCHVGSCQPSLKSLLVFDKSVNVILSSVFTRRDLKHKRYAEQGLLGVPVCHHLQKQHSAN